MSRYNEGKTRYDLIPGFAQEQFARVLTGGANKYGDRNWEKGMNWTTVLASLERHLYAIKRGEDYDPESGLLHSAHYMCNAAMLTEYYRITPQFDDRSIHIHLRIGLDIDEVLADFVNHYNNHFQQDIPADWWNYDSQMGERLKELKDNEEFWINIPRKIEPKDIPFEPVCYITSRICPTEITAAWLEKNGFPSVPIYSTNDTVKIAKEKRLDWFVDDKYQNFISLNNAGICCFLWDAPHNQRYNVGHKRIKSLNELIINDILSLI